MQAANLISTDSSKPIPIVPKRSNIKATIVFLVIMLLLVSGLAILGSMLVKELSKQNVQVSPTSTVKPTASMSLSPVVSIVPSISTTPQVTPSEIGYFGRIIAIADDEMILSQWQLITEGETDFSKYCNATNECPNGYYLVDLKKNITLSIDQKTEIKVINDPANECILTMELVPIKITLAQLTANVCFYLGDDAQAYFDIVALDSKITLVKQVYFP